MLSHSFVNPATSVENLDTLWASMLQLVKRYFGENIPEKNLEGVSECHPFDIPPH